MADIIQADQIQGALYKRKYRILVIASDGSTLFDNLPGTTGSGNAIDLSELHCLISFEKNFMQTQQFGSVVIYNLNAETETAIFKECVHGSVTVRIEAGYETGPYGLVFQGRVFEPTRGKEEANSYYLKLICLDGDDSLNLGFAKFTIYAGYDAETILNEICRSSTIPFTPKVNGSLSKQKTARGKVVFGNVGKYVRSIAINNNAGMYNNNGVTHITTLHAHAPTSKDAQNVVKLNAQSGMVNIPEQIQNGVRVKSLINPNIQIGEWIYLNNQDINLAEIQLGQLQTLLDLDGFYRVINIRCIGDTRGNDWYYDIETVSQVGMLPAMLVDNTATGF